MFGRSGDLAHRSAILVPSCFSSCSSPCLCLPRQAGTWHSSYPSAASCNLELLASKNKSKQHQGLGGLSLLQRRINGLCVGDEANTTWPFVERQLFLCLKSSDTESQKKPQNAGNPASLLLEVCFSSQLKKKNYCFCIFVPEVEGRILCSFSSGARKDRLLGRCSLCLFNFFSPNVKSGVILSWKPARCLWAWDKNTHGGQGSASLLSNSSTTNILVHIFVDAPACRSPQLLQIASPWPFLDTRVHTSVGWSAFRRRDTGKRPTWIWGSWTSEYLSIWVSSGSVAGVAGAGWENPAGAVDCSVHVVGRGCRGARGGSSKVYGPDRSSSCPDLRSHCVWPPPSAWAMPFSHSYEMPDILFFFYLKKTVYWKYVCMYVTLCPIFLSLVYSLMGQMVPLLVYSFIQKYRWTLIWCASLSIRGISNDRTSSLGLNFVICKMGWIMFLPVRAVVRIKWEDVY